MSGLIVLARKHSTLLGFVLLALLWEVAGQRQWVGDGALPAPSAVLQAWYRDRTDYPAHFWGTL